MSESPVSKSLSYTYAGPHEALEDFTAAGRVEWTLWMMHTVNSNAVCFSSVVSTELANNVTAGCEHYYAEVCGCNPALPESEA